MSSRERTLRHPIERCPTNVSIVDVHCDEGVTDDERTAIDTWIHMHDLDDIDTVVVGAQVVAIHGLAKDRGVAGTARRHGDVIAELDEALAMMRQTRDG